VSGLQAHKLLQIYTNTDYCLVAFCTWIPPTSGLIGTIPAQLSMLTRLTTLDLSTNSLQSPIPSSLGLLTSLTQFRISDNALVNGSIPADVPFAGFPRTGDCEMGRQCGACTYSSCCYAPYGKASQTSDPLCNGTSGQTQRRYTLICQLCGFFDTGKCTRANECQNASLAEGVCGADCAHSS
jgi:hypothetical protein